MPDETERAPEITQIANESVEQRPVPPICPHCYISMKWYKSTLAGQNPKLVEDRFSCSSCGRIAIVGPDGATLLEG